MKGQALRTPRPVPILAGILPSTPGPVHAQICTLHFALCVAVIVVPLIAVKAANAPGIRLLGWSSLADKIQARSTVEAGDDFRQDLRRWTGKEGWSESWTFNGSGFVIPGQLAIDIRSVPLANYRLEFAGQIERNGLGFVYRAMDFDNYYAARIVILIGSSTPEAVLERYAVINGQAGPVTAVRLPFPVRTDVMYDVEIEAAGDRFVTSINHQPVDAFYEQPAAHGVARVFFASPGESSRIYRFHVSGHNDLLGKACSLLALASRSGHFKSRHASTYFRVLAFPSFHRGA